MEGHALHPTAGQVFVAHCHMKGIMVDDVIHSRAKEMNQKVLSPIEVDSHYHRLDQLKNAECQALAKMNMGNPFCTGRRKRENNTTGKIADGLDSACQVGLRSVERETEENEKMEETKQQLGHEGVVVGSPVQRQQQQQQDCDGLWARVRELKLERRNSIAEWEENTREAAAAAEKKRLMKKELNARFQEWKRYAAHEFKAGFASRLQRHRQLALKMQPNFEGAQRLLVHHVKGKFRDGAVLDDCMLLNGTVGDHLEREELKFEEKMKALANGSWCGRTVEEVFGAGEKCSELESQPGAVLAKDLNSRPAIPPLAGDLDSDRENNTLVHEQAQLPKPKRLSNPWLLNPSHVDTKGASSQPPPIGYLQPTNKASQKQENPRYRIWTYREQGRLPVYARLLNYDYGFVQLMLPNESACGGRVQLFTDPDLAYVESMTGQCLDVYKIHPSSACKEGFEQVASPKSGEAMVPVMRSELEAGREIGTDSKDEFEDVDIGINDEHADLNPDWEEMDAVDTLSEDSWTEVAKESVG